MMRKLLPHNFNLKLTWVLLLLLSSLCGWSQSLVKDLGFNGLKQADTCYHPRNAIFYSDDWYSAYGSADLYISQCEYPTWGFWDGYDNRSYMGIFLSLSFKNQFFGEGFATKLKKPLEAGRLYYIGAQVDTRGVSISDPDLYPLQTCPTNPPKRIVAVVSEDSLLSADQFIEPDVTFSDDRMSRIDPQSFWPYGGCFRAKGGEQHLGMGWGVGEFFIDPPCFPLDTIVHYYVTYAFIDSLDLYPMPEEFVDTVELCVGQGLVSFDGSPWVRQFAIRDAEIEWEDGQKGLSRTFDAEGTYECEVVFPCGSIPGRVVVAPKDCRTFFFVPTAFSPNGDNENDRFQPVLRTSIEVLDFQFRVYDRWGRKLTEWSDPYTTWDGNVEGRKVLPGVYMWEVAMTFSRNGEVLGYRDKGALTILR